jgi:transcriptional regulator with XRE-family HTH domain
MNIGDTLKERRLQKGFTQSQLAEESGITLRTIQRIENNAVRPSVHSINALCRVLEIDFSTIRPAIDIPPYEFDFKFKITDMNQFIHDMIRLLKTHWKPIALLILLFWMLGNYTDIKRGIMDGWIGR